MATGKVGKLYVEIGADDKPLQDKTEGRGKVAKEVDSQVEAIHRASVENLSKLGNKLTLGLTVPLAAESGSPELCLRSGRNIEQGGCSVRRKRDSIMIGPPLPWNRWGCRGNGYVGGGHLWQYGCRHGTDGKPGGRDG